MTSGIIGRLKLNLTSVLRQSKQRALSSKKTPSSNFKGEILFVVGGHRCGTSVVTRIANLCGYGQRSNLLEANAGNPTGYWEDREVVEVNDLALAKIGYTWDDYRPMPKGLLESRHLEQPKKLMSGILQDFMSHHLRLVIKDPRLCRLLPLWLDVARNMELETKALLAVRGPMEACKSLVARDGTKMQHAAHLWMRYVWESLLNTQYINRAVIKYEALIDNPLHEIRTAFDAAGIEIANKVDYEQINKFVQPVPPARSAFSELKYDEVYEDKVLSVARRCYGKLQGDENPFFKALQKEIRLIENSYYLNNFAIDRFFSQRGANKMETIKSKYRPPNLANAKVEIQKKARKISEMKYCAILGTQRSGTTVLRSVVNSHPDINAFGEVFLQRHLNNKECFYNFFLERIAKDPKLAIPDEDTNDKLFSEYLEYLASLSGDADMIAFDCKYNFLVGALVPGSRNPLGIPFLLRLMRKNVFKFLHIVRENVLEVYVSSLLSIKNRVWATNNLEQVRARSTIVPIENLVSALRSRSDEIQYHDRLLSGNDILRISYKEAFKDGECTKEIVESIAEFLGMPNKFVQTPQYKKIALPLEQAIENADEVRDVLSGTEFDHLLSNS